MSARGYDPEPGEIERVVTRARRRLGLVASFSPRAFLRRPGAGPLVAFVHIPKTAGATVTSVFVGAYSKAEVREAGNYLRHPEKTPRKIAWGRWTGAWAEARVVVGHIPYGLFRKNLSRDTRYVTFLREPVDRVLSHYHRHISRKSLTTDSLEEALKTGMPDVNNLATRFLCGDPLPLGELPASALDDAKANLREFAFVGIQERFEESVVLLQRMLGLGPVPFVNRHLSIERPGVDDIPQRQRGLIAEYNRLDTELYAFALQLFEEALAATDDGFASDVERLRASSQDANEEAIQNAREWLDRELPVGTTRSTVALYSAADAAGVQIPALKHVIERSLVKKVKDRSGGKAFTRGEGSGDDIQVKASRRLPPAPRAR